MGGTYWHGIYGHPLYEYALKQHITQPPHTRGGWKFSSSSSMTAVTVIDSGLLSKCVPCRLQMGFCPAWEAGACGA